MDRRRKSYHKVKLSADAKLIIALFKKQPQTKRELSKSACVNMTTVHRNLLTFLERGIIKKTKRGFALWTYVELEMDIEKILDKMDTNYITFNKIASEVGVNPSAAEFKSILYRIVKKRGLEVRVENGEKVVAEVVEGRVLS